MQAVKITNIVAFVVYSVSCNGLLARQANLHPRVRVPVGSIFMRPCAKSKHKVRKLLNECYWGTSCSVMVMQVNFHERVRVSLDALFIRPCAISDEKA